MVQITKENGMQSAGVPFAWVEVQYPDKVQWDETGFYDMVEQHVAALREQYREYVRADVFGQNPYFRYFRKFKKTYPVMMQFESVLLKGREFPRWNAVTAVPFLAELETHVLCGTHDKSFIPSHQIIQVDFKEVGYLFICFFGSGIRLPTFIERDHFAGQAKALRCLLLC